MSGKGRRRRMTAEELAVQLEEDPEFVAAEERRERQRRERQLENTKAAAPIVAELRQLGLDVESVDDLFNRRMDYRVAIPILMEWLPRAPNRDIRESIVRSLSVKWAKSAAPLMIDQFRTLEDDPQSSVRWAIGNALEVIADDKVYEDVVELARDRRYGRARQMIVLALGKMRDPRAVNVLLELLDDEVVAGQAVAALGRLKVAETRSAIEPFLDHPKTWVRREARNAIKKIDHRASRRKEVES